jgi:multidrug efflux pump subunit AcrA (membrane-fusion protein)
MTDQPISSEHPTTQPYPQADTSTRSMMINVVIPTLLLVGSIVFVYMLGTVEPEQLPAADNTRVGRLRALPPVRVERLRSLESTGEQLRLEVDGTVVPFREARVAAEVAGRIIFKDPNCEAGNFVTQGQVLMRIDKTDYELEVQRLSRLRDQEYQSLGEIDQEMVNTQRSIEIAKQDVDLQQKEVSRLVALPKDFASPAEIDKANRTLLAAQQQLVGSENQLNLLKKRRERLESSEQLAATQLRAAQINLERTEILAPIDGVIAKEDADLNTFVARGATLVTIEDTSKVEVVTNLRMDQLYWVLDQEGTQVSEGERGYKLPETPAVIEYKLSGRDDVTYRWSGQLLSYDGIGLDAQTRTVPVRVLVENPQEYIDEQGKTEQVSGATALVRGMFVHVYLLIKPKTPLVVIPARALQPGNRVFQFVPDESVLATESESSNKSESSEPAMAVKPIDGETSTDAKFDADKWEPGRVYVRKSIHPVDTLTVGTPQTPANAWESQGVDRMWVCEVRDEFLRGDSLVVTSPLAAIEEEAMPVRADRMGIDGGNHGPVKTASETTNEASVRAASRGGKEAS